MALLSDTMFRAVAVQAVVTVHIGRALRKIERFDIPSLPFGPKATELAVGRLRRACTAAAAIAVYTPTPTFTAIRFPAVATAGIRTRTRVVHPGKNRLMLAIAPFRSTITALTSFPAVGMNLTFMDELIPGIVNSTTFTPGAAAATAATAAGQVSL